jgi:anti-anti-sigma regulatory factor
MSQVVLTTSETLDIRQVAAQQTEWLEKLAEPGEVTVDLKRLTKIDTAGVQLLISLGKELEASEREAKWEGLEAVVLPTAATLGIPASAFGGN